MNRIHLSFKLRTNRENVKGTYPLYLYANINKEVKFFTLNRFIPLSAWNEKRQEVRSSFKDWNLINDDISRYRAKAEEMRIAADKSEELISIIQFERVFRRGAKDLIDIFSYIEEDINQFGNIYAHATVKMYESQSRKLKKYCDKLKFHEITPLFWKQYDSYLISLDNNENTRWKAYRTLKTLINKAIQDGIIKTDPLRGVKVRKPEGNRQYLNQEEVKKLENMYSGVLKKDFKRVLQSFLFSCYTGLRFSDIKHLKNSNISYENGHPYISLKQLKTNKLVEVPLGTKAQLYLSEKGTPDQPVFKMYGNQNTNRLLKDIMSLAGINKSISFHCARHTFATIALELSGDIAVVSKLCGHTKISTTQIYAKVLDSSKRNVIGLMDAM
jgi:site-specific recombinase XerD